MTVLQGVVDRFLYYPLRDTESWEEPPAGLSELPEERKPGRRESLERHGPGEYRSGSPLHLN